MKFMFIVKSASTMGPSPKLLEEMHKLAKREIEAGRLDLDLDVACAGWPPAARDPGETLQTAAPHR